MEYRSQILKVLDVRFGQDRILRFIQYSAFTLYSMMRFGQFRELGQRANQLTKGIRLARMAYKFGLPMQLLLKVLYKELPKPFEQRYITKIIARIFKIVFYCTSHLIFLRRAKVIKVYKTTQFIQVLEIVHNISWVISRIFAIIYDCMIIKRYQNQMQEMRDLNEHSNYSKKRPQYEKLMLANQHNVLDLLRALCDIPVGLFFVDPTRFSPMIAGGFGMLSSYIGFYKVIRDM